MKSGEDRAHEYLESLGLGEVVYEPLGRGTTPDFAIGNSIAVEVRRLNQNYLVDNGRIRSLEEDHIPLMQRFERLVEHFRPEAGKLPKGDKTWFVCFTIKWRPIESWKTLEPKIKAALQMNYDRESESVSLSDNFEIRFLPSEKTFASTYRMGGFNDYESGGWLLQLLRRNTSLCIAAKKQALERLGAYEQKWLLLIDHIGFGSTEDFPIDRQGWDRVIVLAPFGKLTAYEPRQVEG